MTTGKEDMTAGSGRWLITRRSQKERTGSEVRHETLKADLQSTLPPAMPHLLKVP